MTMAADRTILDEPHHQSLELLAARALADGNLEPAFKYADRRCRILPAPEPHCYVLRGEASFQMGARGDAIADVEKALEIAPGDIAANRRMLAWAKGSRQIRAASALIGHDHDVESLRKAIQVLRKHGHRHLAKVTAFDDAIEGWAVWEDEDGIEVSIDDGVTDVCTLFEADAFHPLAGECRATNFRVRRPKSPDPQSILLTVGGAVFYRTRAAGNDTASQSRVPIPEPVSTRDQPVTVIVPVHGDYEATRNCLESLQRELGLSCHRAILIDDASPDRRITRYLAKLGKEPRIEVLTNDQNLGFIGSTNRALARVREGDVIILNSDTIVPHGFIDRLAAIAGSSDNIGTVTPLSNNGEFVSFPIPNTSNPLPPQPEMKRIDDIAAKINAGTIVDIPSGIGFCLYIKRACLNAVGLLSEDFGRGYLEDTDFCLRARDRGFRSVCAPSVYVAHAGSKSFAQDKRSLVVRNLGVLERRFPDHRSECAAFIAADPLRDAREAIERTAAPGASCPTLLVTGAGTVGAIARERARELVAECGPVLILEVRNHAEATMVNVIEAAGAMPQSLRFRLLPSGENASLSDFLRGLGARRIEIVDPVNAPPALVDLLLALQVPYDIFITDSGLVTPDNEQLFANAVRPLVARASRRNGAPIELADAPKFPNCAGRWRKIAEGAERIIVPCAEARAFAAAVLPPEIVHKISIPARKQRRAPPMTRTAGSGKLGLVPVRCCAHEQWLMSELARAFSRIRPEVSVSIIGAALDDIDLMRAADAFVTGAVKADEFGRIAASLGLTHLFVSATRPLFGHPILTAARLSPLPIAYFDWSAGSLKPNRNDLAIDPNASLDQLIGALNQWTQ
jgi:O-antigen biosynthesis protein